MRPSTIATAAERSRRDSPAAARFLERALLFAFVIHGLAMLAMAGLLLPGMPGGTSAGAPARMAYVAAHPWLWRVGWVPWQLTALSDVLIGLALVRTPWIPRLPAALALLDTLLGLLPDQAGELLWMTRGVALAQQGDVARYAAFEARVFSWTAAWGATGYTLEGCEPLAGTVDSLAARRIVGGAEPFCFRVPRVRFSFLREEYDRLPV